MGMRSMLTMATEGDLLFVADGGGWTGIMKLNKKDPGESTLKKWNKIFETQTVKSQWLGGMLFLMSKSGIKAFTTESV